jgi:glutamyl-tRNA reductase
LKQMEDPRSREIVERLCHRVVNKILHEPSSRLKALAANGNGIVYADAIRELFALDDRPKT